MEREQVLVAFQTLVAGIRPLLAARALVEPNEHDGYHALVTDLADARLTVSLRLRSRGFPRRWAVLAQGGRGAGRPRWAYLDAEEGLAPEAFAPKIQEILAGERAVRAVDRARAAEEAGLHAEAEAALGLPLRWPAERRADGASVRVAVERGADGALRLGLRIEVADLPPVAAGRLYRAVLAAVGAEHDEVDG